MLLAGPGAAGAATVTSDGATLTYTAAPGEQNDLTITEPLSATGGAAFVYLVEDRGADIIVLLPGTCAGVTLPRNPLIQKRQWIACVATQGVTVDLGDGNDRAFLTVNAVRTTATGGEGNDTLRSTASAYGQQADLFGGPGDDTLIAGDAPNLLDGGPGDDELRGAGDTPGEDTLIGGDGNDVLYGDRDPPPAIHNSDHGEDRIFGGAGNDLLDGGPDGDWLDGGPGEDSFRADGDPEEDPQGDDTIISDDGIGEPVTCGGGEDSVDADSLDVIEPDCEIVT